MKAQGKYVEAEQLAQKALAIYSTSHGIDHPAMADNFNSLALIQYEQGKFEAAEEGYKKSLEIAEAAYGGNHSRVSDCLADLGNFYVKLGRYEQVHHTSTLHSTSPLHSIPPFQGRAVVPASNQNQRDSIGYRPPIGRCGVKLFSLSLWRTGQIRSSGTIVPTEPFDPRKGT